MRDSTKRRSLRNPARKNLRRNKAHLHALVAEAILDRVQRIRANCRILYNDGA